MKFSALALAALAATSAFAGDRVTGDRVTGVDYLRANRCKGLATTLGSVDTAALDTFIKAEGRSRQSHVVDRGRAEMTKAAREARHEERRNRLAAELSGPCMAYIGGGVDLAKRYSNTLATWALARRATQPAGAFFLGRALSELT
ncbi:hypothetical protein [Phenylobacterium sp.]|uniref:hypothetical protein n=1 Tax=Phenylobacterium sp. TaxID=1871053 RepID=UPI003983A367